jgi:exodeoxyribonuclease-3
MRIATWNVNSVRSRLPRVLEFLERQKPDVLCMQEIKCQDEQFPYEPLQDAGYQCAVFGQKTYNGVAILSKRRIEDVRKGMDDGHDDVEARVMSAQVEDVILVNAYVVNGQYVGADKYHYKLEWLGRLGEHVRTNFSLQEKLVVVGDFNVTFDDRDVHDPDLWREKILCSTPEREALGKILRHGLQDVFRKFHEEGGHYTWWDFRTMGFKRGLGLRIDHALLSPPAFEAATAVEIDLDARGGEKPSDHAPLIVTLG